MVDFSTSKDIVLDNAAIEKRSVFINIVLLFSKTGCFQNSVADILEYPGCSDKRGDAL